MTEPIKNDAARTMIAALTKPCTALPEHTILNRLTGEWQLEGDWYILPGHPPEHMSAQVENAGILGGHFIESKTFKDGHEGSRVIYGFDPTESHFFAFAINMMAARSDLEFGHYDAQADTLCFSGVEPVGPKNTPLRFERRISFLSADAYNVVVSYPERPAERRLAMDLRVRRLPASTP